MTAEDIGPGEGRSDPPRWSVPPVGLSFVPEDVVTALHPGVPPSEALGRVVRDLGLAFAFVPASYGVEAVEAVEATGARAMWVVDGPFGTVAGRLGWTEALQAAVRRPESLTSELDDALEIALETAEAGLGAGGTALVVADDLAGTSGPLVPPDFALSEVFPRLERLVRAARSAGDTAIWHSDGDVRVFLPAARRTGFAGIHGGGGLDWHAFERLFDAARAESLLVFGGIPTPELGVRLTKAVVAGTRAGVLAQRGGLLVADDGGMTTPGEMSAFTTAAEAARGRAHAGGGAARA